MQRIQFLMTDDKADQLDELVKETGLKTRTQLLDVAVTLFEWAVKERKAGRIIAAVDEKTEQYKEIVVPGFPDIPTQKLDEILAAFQAAVNDLGANTDAISPIQRKEVANLVESLFGEKPTPVELPIQANNRRAAAKKRGLIEEPARPASLRENRAGYRAKDSGDAVPPAEAEK